MRLTCALPSRRLVVVLKEIFLVAPDGRGRSYDLLLLGAGGTLVRATAARIATHAYAMPPATQPAVTRASPILIGCRMHAGQVLSAEHHHDGGLRAGRVALDQRISLSVTRGPTARRIPVLGEILAYAPMRAFILRWIGRLVRACEGPRGIERGRSGFRAWTGYQACLINCTYNVECVEARRLGGHFHM